MEETACVQEELENLTESALAQLSTVNGETSEQISNGLPSVIGKNMEPKS